MICAVLIGVLGAIVLWQNRTKVETVLVWIRDRFARK